MRDETRIRNGAKRAKRAKRERGANVANDARSDAMPLLAVSRRLLLLLRFLVRLEQPRAARVPVYRFVVEVIHNQRFLLAS